MGSSGFNFIAYLGTWAKAIVLHGVIVQNLPTKLVMEVGKRPILNPLVVLSFLVFEGNHHIPYASISNPMLLMLVYGKEPLEEFFWHV